MAQQAMRAKFLRLRGMKESAMNTIVTALSRLQLASPSSLAVRLPDFITLMKPRVMMLAVFTALVGLAGAPLNLDRLHGFLAVVAIAVGRGRHRHA
jgi:heme o synthase